MSHRSRWSSRLGDPSLIVAVIGTVAYYAAVFHPALKGGVLFRYTTEHPVEYVIVFMFFWGMADVVLKLCSFPREFMALSQEWIVPRTGREPAENAAGMLQAVESQSPGMRESRIGRRLISALSYITESGSSEGLSEHLRYLAEQDDESTYNRYSLVRFVVAVTPILGFLGTVVHFGTALSGLSFAGMDDGLSHVVSEMGTAFNTTTVALGAAMLAMFSMFLCERVENGFIGRINRFVERELANRFVEHDAKLTPFLSILKAAHEESQAALAVSLNQQVEVLSKSLDALFQQFDQRQQHEADRWQQTLAAVQEQHRGWDSEREERLRQILTLIETRSDTHMEQVQAALLEATAFSSDVGTLVLTMNGIARGEGRLLELQTTLSDNLRVLHETNQIDGALHGLTAAIHLLTVRNGGMSHREAA